MAETPLSGRVALVTGAARGMGRSHALALAAAGADLVLCDLCQNLPSVAYPLASRDDLERTAHDVEAIGRSAMPVVVDVRDRDGFDRVVKEAVGRLGHIDVLIANAGISAPTPILGADPAAWDDVIGINLTGAFNSVRAVAPVMVSNRWGRIVLVSSMLGRSSSPTQAAYVASKWGVIGLAKASAQDLASHGITVNAVAPGNVDTPMVRNDALFRTVRPDLENPTAEDAAAALQMLHLQRIPWLEPQEITDAVMFLVTAEHITGSVIDVNAGASARFTA